MEQTVQNSLVLRGITKAYGGNEVLKGVDLAFKAGEVHALLGPNGAGKSTLLGCLSGATQPDSGTIELGGITYTEFTPKDAFGAGMSIIYQSFQLIGELSIAENTFLGAELITKARVDRAAQNRRTIEILESLGTDLDPTRLVETLTIGEQQIVEIARALRHKPSVLILDEPTAALGDREVQSLLELVRRLAHQNGMAVIFVTHILREVLAVADVVTVIRDGCIQWTQPRDEVTFDSLIEGIAPLAHAVEKRNKAELGTPIIEFASYSSAFTGPIDLSVNQGEIIGFFGLLGSGRTDLLETIAGVRMRGTGRMTLHSRPVAPISPTEAMQAGIALVASDRKVQAFFDDMTAEENLLIPHYTKLSKPFRSLRRERRVFTETADHVNLLPRSPHTDGGFLSGGNAQKLMVGRWLSGVQDIQLLLLDEPTQGVDVGARGELYALFRAFAAEQSRAILFATSDPDEIVALADRVVVLARGHVSAIRNSDITEAELLKLGHT